MYNQLTIAEQVAFQEEFTRYYDAAYATQQVEEYQAEQDDKAEEVFGPYTCDEYALEDVIDEILDSAFAPLNRTRVARALNYIQSTTLLCFDVLSPKDILCVSNAVSREDSMNFDALCPKIAFLSDKSAVNAIISQLTESPTCEKQVIIAALKHLKASFCQ